MANDIVMTNDIIMSNNIIIFSYKIKDKSIENNFYCEKIFLSDYLLDNNISKNLTKIIRFISYKNIFFVIDILDSFDNYIKNIFLKQKHLEIEYINYIECEKKRIFEKLKKNIPIESKLPILYYGTGSAFSWCIIMALKKYNIDFYPRIMRVTKKKDRKHETIEDWFLKINPIGEVPVLIFNENIITDSTEILIFIDEKYNIIDLKYKKKYIELLNGKCKDLEKVFKIFSENKYLVKEKKTDNEIFLQVNPIINDFSLILGEKKFFGHTICDNDCFNLIDMKIFSFLGWIDYRKYNFNQQNIIEYIKRVKNEDKNNLSLPIGWKY